MKNTFGFNRQPICVLEILKVDLFQFFCHFTKINPYSKPSQIKTEYQMKATFICVEYRSLENRIIK